MDYGRKPASTGAIPRDCVRLLQAWLTDGLGREDRGAGSRPGWSRRGRHDARCVCHVHGRLSSNPGHCDAAIAATAKETRGPEKACRPAADKQGSDQARTNHAEAAREEPGQRLARADGQAPGAKRFDGGPRRQDRADNVIPPATRRQRPARTNVRHSRGFLSRTHELELVTARDCYRRLGIVAHSSRWSRGMMELEHMLREPTGSASSTALGSLPCSRSPGNAISTPQADMLFPSAGSQSVHTLWFHTSSLTPRFSSLLDRPRGQATHRTRTRPAPKSQATPRAKGGDKHDAIIQRPRRSRQHNSAGEAQEPATTRRHRDRASARPSHPSVPQPRPPLTAVSLMLW